MSATAIAIATRHPHFGTLAPDARSLSLVVAMGSVSVSGLATDDPNVLPRGRQALEGALALVPGEGGGSIDRELGAKPTDVVHAALPVPGPKRRR